MSVLRINEILGKLNELRAVFVLGQRAVPFLEEVFAFLREISPLMDEINNSLRDTTGKMPHARSQLESVTQATELATNEIMDLIDATLGMVRTTKKGLEDAQEIVESLRRDDATVIRLLRSELGSEHAHLMGRIEQIHETKKDQRRKLDHRLRGQIGQLDEIRDAMNRIMMSLQVQDITTQQIAAVNHLIEGIRDRMNALSTRLGSTPPPPAPYGADYVHMPGAFIPTPEQAHPREVFEQPQRSTFDPNARYDPTGQRQTTADEVIASFGAGTPPPTDPAPAAPSGPASQDDIDALFGGDLAPAAPSGPASQNDIDALFGGDPAPAEASEPASQDDIDALFGG